jgi:hypothetical protein
MKKAKAAANDAGFFSSLLRLTRPPITQLRIYQK